tara:strand:- start:16419 stop:16571 length:153 start_codon:yes stop_codon:yes gene_type:complete
MKNTTPKLLQSSSPQGQSVTTLSLFAAEELAGLLILPVLVCLYWLWKVLA